MMIGTRDGWIRASGASRRAGCLLIAALLLAASASARAEVQRVEAVGIYGIRDSMRSRVIPRDEAIARARWEGVSRVARELMGESGTAFDGEGDDRSEGQTAKSQGDGALESALGKDTLPYTRGYRILKDQGERPVLFEDSPGIKREYVVVVEVVVDVDRVSAALERAGLVATSDPRATREAVLLEVVGLGRYAALETMKAALLDRLGATRVQTLVFERDRQVLSVEGPFGADGLQSRLSRYRNPRLVLEPLGIDPSSGRLRVMGRWFEEVEPVASTPSG